MKVLIALLALTACSVDNPNLRDRVVKRIEERLYEGIYMMPIGKTVIPMATHDTVRDAIAEGGMRCRNVGENARVGHNLFCNWTDD